jgi:hypothetical protein
VLGFRPPGGVMARPWASFGITGRTSDLTDWAYVARDISQVLPIRLTHHDTASCIS